MPLLSIDVALMGDSRNGGLPMFYNRKYLLDISILEFHSEFTPT